MKDRFKIDKDEFAFLVEACIPPRPIARTMFWHSVINKHFHDMTPDERAHLLHWIEKNSNFKPDTNEDCKWFLDRFDPDNQFEVIAKDHSEPKAFSCFKHFLFIIFTHYFEF